MDTSWLPHWTTVIALACGTGAWMFRRDPQAMKAVKTYNEKCMESLVALFRAVVLVLPLLLLEILFLAIGRSRSPWEWSVAGLALLLLVMWRTWHDLTMLDEYRPPGNAADDREQRTMRDVGPG